MNAMIVGRVHGRESIRLRGARFFFKQILAECTQRHFGTLVLSEGAVEFIVAIGVVV